MDQNKDKEEGESLLKLKYKVEESQIKYKQEEESQLKDKQVECQLKNKEDEEESIISYKSEVVNQVQIINKEVQEK